MLEIVSHILDANTLAYWVAGAMAFAAGTLVFFTSNSFILAGIFVSICWFGALTGVYVFTDFAIVVVPDEEANLLIASLCGMTVFVLLFLAVVRALFGLADFVRPTIKDERAVDPYL